MRRSSLPGELHLDAIMVYPARALDAGPHQPAGDGWVQGVPWDEATVERARAQPPHIALRWVLNPALGIPPEPFTVWRRPVSGRDPAVPLPLRRTGPDTWGWDGVSEMLRIELDLTGPVTAVGLSRADFAPVQTVSGAAGQTIVLDAGPMLELRIDAFGSVAAIRGQSVDLLSNGDGWQPFEIVGLPFGPSLAGTTYYGSGDQGPTSAPTDPVGAAVRRLAAWGPTLGWAPLAGLAPWQPPDPDALVQELQGTVLPDLAEVLAAWPPPQLGSQITAPVEHDLKELHQMIGARQRPLNTGKPGEASKLTVRPLQSLALAVSSDTWASLALGFGTGDALRDLDGVDHDYMVTAPWKGLMTMAVPDDWPFPWLAGRPPKQFVSQEVDRELAAVVLAPGFRPAPGTPSELTAQAAFEEGADSVDEPYHVGVAVRTTRGPALPRQPRASAYGMARFDGAGVGHYTLREHPLAKGWIPICAAAPVPEPGQTADPQLVTGTVMLRDSGVERPLTAASKTYQYAVAATDLFGQWSAWAPAWLSLGISPVQAPGVATVRARAVAGADGVDPCALTVDAELFWNIRERSLHRLRIAVDVYPPTPAPPAPVDDPSASPQGPSVTVADFFLSFGQDGVPTGAPVDVTVTLLDDDGGFHNPVAALGGDDRRYRITVENLPATFGSHHELAVVLYAQAEETVRSGEWSGWVHAREVTLVANPLPPPTPVPLPMQYPDFASLPNAAGLSYAPVAWTPTGAWRYRVYEATEAALLAACGRPGPDLTQGYGERMNTLFGLYTDAANLPKLKAAFRKLGADTVLPPIQSDGKMRFESLLPRGSSLIHCYVVAGVTQANVISSWPQPDADGRKAFLAYAIPQPLRPATPEILARRDGAGQPEIAVRVSGGVSASSIRIYRAADAIRARSVGTMDLIAAPAASAATAAEAPAIGMWQRTVFTDATAPTGWSYLQYRAVADAVDDPEHGRIAVPSQPSRSYALLNPPPDPPSLTLTPGQPGSTATTALVRVDTDALRKGSDIGDFAVAFLATAPATEPVRFRIALSAVPEFASAAAFVGAPQSAGSAGYLGGVLQLRVNRLAGQDLTLAVDVSDPLDRTTHAVVAVPAFVPDPDPSVTLTAVRTAGVVRMWITTNVPLPPDPSRRWKLRVLTQQLPGGPHLPPETMDFSIPGIEVIPTEADMPNPALVPDQYAIRRVDGTGRILLWGRSLKPLRIAVTVTNSLSVAASAQKATS